VQVRNVERKLLLESCWTPLPKSDEEAESDSELESASRLSEGSVVIDLGMPEDLPADLQVTLRTSWEELCGCRRIEKVLCAFWLNTGYVSAEFCLHRSQLDLPR
ncbi:TPTE2, partial [Symbiodinium pilosum]